MSPGLERIVSAFRLMLEGNQGAPSSFNFSKQIDNFAVTRFYLQ